MSIATRLQESMGGRATDSHQLTRMLATSVSHEDRIRRVTEAFDAGRVSLDVYVATMGLRAANVRPASPDEFVAAIRESLDRVPSRTVVAIEAYWRGRAAQKPDVNSLFESLYLECGCGGSSDDDDEDEEEEDDEDEEEDEE